MPLSNWGKRSESAFVTLLEAFANVKRSRLTFTFVHLVSMSFFLFTGLTTLRSAFMILNANSGL